MLQCTREKVKEEIVLNEHKAGGREGEGGASECSFYAA